VDLSLYRICVYSAAITSCWLYLWFGGSRPMRTRRWQTWWELGNYTLLWLLGWWGMQQENLLDIFAHIGDVWHYPPVHSHYTVLYFEMEIAWYLSSLIRLLIQRDLSDFYAMLFHHLITPVEIFFSYDVSTAAHTHTQRTCRAAVEHLTLSPVPMPCLTCRSLSSCLCVSAATLPSVW
jgi:hypothetical protein